jgi:hypothetical protein
VFTTAGTAINNGGHGDEKLTTAGTALNITTEDTVGTEDVYILKGD